MLAEEIAPRKIVVAAVKQPTIDLQNCRFVPAIEGGDVVPWKSRLEVMDDMEVVVEEQHAEDGRVLDDRRPMLDLVKTPNQVVQERLASIPSTDHPETNTQAGPCDVTKAGLIVEAAKRSHNQTASISTIDDGPGKPVISSYTSASAQFFAFGNSDGDLQMLQWTSLSSSASFMGIVHHADAEREWAYDRKSSIGRLDKALDEAQTRGWNVVDMKNDWKIVFPFDTEL